MIRTVDDIEEKQRITKSILTALPEWFGIPESTENYIRESANEIMVASFEGEKENGFLCLKETGKDTVEITVMATSSIIIVGADRKNEKDIHKLLPRCVEAACMEIPQRAMMQSFTEVVLIYFGLNGFISILITALIWCAAQGVQLSLFKQKATKTFWIEMIASFVFSLEIGYSFWASKFIPMTMLCHGIERFVTNTIDKA